MLGIGSLSVQGCPDHRVVLPGGIRRQVGNRDGGVPARGGLPGELRAAFEDEPADETLPPPDFVEVASNDVVALDYSSRQKRH
jgi:hypothetical protein